MSKVNVNFTNSFSGNRAEFYPPSKVGLAQGATKFWPFTEEAEFPGILARHVEYHCFNYKRTRNLVGEATLQIISCVGCRHQNV